MGPEGAVNIVYKREIDRAPEADREKIRREKIDDFRDRFANPYVAAERGYIDAIIEPAQTRAQTNHPRSAPSQTKRDTNPRKKHGKHPALILAASRHRPSASERTRVAIRFCDVVDFLALLTVRSTRG